MPSVFKLSLSIKRTRPRTLGGKPSMISTDAAGLRFLSGAPNRCARGRSAEICWRANESGQALAATTAGEPKYTNASRSPMRPLKLRLVALIAVSPFCTRPRPSPMHAPQPGGSGIAPAPRRVCQSPLRLGLGLRLGAGRRQIEFDTIGDASAARANDFGGVVQIFEARVHARQQICLLNRHMFRSISGSETIVFTSLGPDTCGTTVARSSSSSIAYSASGSALNSLRFSTTHRCRRLCNRTGSSGRAFPGVSDW
jgi:hypothetical protein